LTYEEKLLELFIIDDDEIYTRKKEERSGILGERAASRQMTRHLIQFLRSSFRDDYPLADENG
jgi:hypothetical protein